MSMEYGFFNSVNGDRKKSADFFAMFFGNIIGNGVYPNPSSNFQVMANGDMTITIGAGIAWINGAMCEDKLDYITNIDIADGVLNRIDRVVLRLDTIDREIRIDVKKGTFASSPVAPILQRDADAYELALADVYVGNGMVSISQSNITDTRLNSELCGIVHGVVDQVDVTTLYNQYTQGFELKKEEFEQEFLAWFATLQDVLDENTATNLLNMINATNSNLGDLSDDLVAHKADYATFKEETDAMLPTVKSDTNQLKREVANLKFYQEATQRIENGVVFADNFEVDPMMIVYNDELSLNSRDEFSTQEIKERLQLGLFTGATSHAEWGTITVNDSQIVVNYYYSWDARYPYPIDLTDVTKIEVTHRTVCNVKFPQICVNTTDDVSWMNNVRSKSIPVDSTNTIFTTTLDTRDLEGEHYLGISADYESSKPFSYRQRATILSVAIYRNADTTSITYDLPKCMEVCAFVKKDDGVQVKAFINGLEAIETEYDDETMFYQNLDTPAEANLRFDTVGVPNGKVYHIIGGIGK